MTSAMESLLQDLAEGASTPQQLVARGLAAGPKAFAGALLDAERAHSDRVREVIDALGRCREEAAAAVLVAYRERSQVKRLRKAAGQALALVAGRGVEMAAQRAGVSVGPGEAAQEAAQAGEQGDAETAGAEGRHADVRGSGGRSDGVGTADRTRLLAAVPYRARSFRQQRVTPELHALVTLYDGEGHRLALVPFASPRGLFATLLVEFDASGTLERVEVMPYSKREFVSWHNRKDWRAYERFMAVPVEYGRYLFRRGLARRRESGRPDPEWDGVHPDEVAAGPDFPRPLVFLVAPERVADAREHLDDYLRRSGGLMNGLLHPWVPIKAIEPEWELARTVLEGKLEVSFGGGWLSQFTERAVSRLYNEAASRALYAERFYELAYRLWAEGWDRAAACAVAVGLGLEDPTRPVRGITILENLAATALVMRYVSYRQQRGDGFDLVLTDLEQEVPRLEDEEESQEPQEGSTNPSAPLLAAGPEELGQVAAQLGLRRLNWERAMPAWQETRHHLLAPKGAGTPSSAPASRGGPADETDDPEEPRSSGAPLSAGWERRGRLIVPRQGSR